MLGLFVSRCFLRLTISAIDNGELHQLAPFIVVVSRRQKMAYALDTLSQFLLAQQMIVIDGCDEHVQRLLQMIPSRLSAKSLLFSGVLNV